MHGYAWTGQLQVSKLREITVIKEMFTDQAFASRAAPQLKVTA